MKMKILWEVDLACCVNYEKLFAPIENVSVKMVYTLPLKKTGVRSMIGKMYIGCLRQSSFYLTSRETRQRFADSGEAVIEKMRCDNKKYCIKSKGIFADWEHLAEVIDLLKPSAEVEDRVNNNMEFYEGHPTFGIYIRRTDNTLAIQNSPISVFTDQMKKIMGEKPNARFYLATDDKTVEQNLSKKFPLIIHKSFSEEKTRTTESGMMDAYVDMLCLGKCDKIYRSYQSAFSQMASLIGKKECIVLQKDAEKCKEMP